MDAMLRISRWIDRLNERVGRGVYWLVLVAVVVSAVNAIVRKVFNYSSNAFLEAQWYLFSAIFLLCAGYTLLRNEHVRIDVVAGRFSRRTQAWIDILGTVFFLLPMALAFVYLSWPIFVRTWVHEEISGSAGGLVIWPARLLVPIGFSLLALQGLSELVKRIGFLRGVAPDPGLALHGHSAERELAGEIRRIAETRP